MKICLVNNLYKPYARGGAERAVELAALGLEELGHEVMVISRRPVFSRPPAGIPGNIVYLPGTYHYWDKIPKVLRPAFHFFNIADPAAARRLRRMIENKQIDILITNNLLGVNMLFLRRLKPSVRHIHVLHDIQLLHPAGLMFYGRENIIDTRLARLYQSFTRRFFSKTDKVVSPSRWLLDEHLKRGFFPGRETQVLLNPLDLAGNPAFGRQDRPKSKFFRIIYVGLLSEAKGLISLFKAFEILSGTSAAFCLDLVGKNLLGAALGRHLRDKPGIRYHGELGHGQVLEKMAQADVLAAPSCCYENSPTVVCEALSLGLPVAASRIGGIPELLAGREAVLFTPGDHAG